MSDNKRSSKEVIVVTEDHPDYKLISEMLKKPKKEINLMCDSGMFNTIIEGYCRVVFEDLGLSDKLKDYSFYHLFDNVSAGEARAKAERK